MNADSNTPANRSMPPVAAPRAANSAGGGSGLPPLARKAPAAVRSTGIEHLPSFQAAMQAFRQSLRMLDA